MKKFVVFAAVVAVAGAVAGKCYAKYDQEKRKRELIERDPEELITLLKDARALLDLEEDLDMDMDECTRAKFDSAKTALREKI